MVYGIGEWIPFCHSWSVIVICKDHIQIMLKTILWFTVFIFNTSSIRARRNLEKLVYLLAWINYTSKNLLIVLLILPISHNYSYIFGMCSELSRRTYLFIVSLMWFTGLWDTISYYTIGIIDFFNTLYIFP